MAAWLYVVLPTAALLVLLCVPKSPLRVRSAIGGVRRGRFEAMLCDLPALDPTLMADLQTALDDLDSDRTGAGGVAGTDPGLEGFARPPGREALLDAAVPGVLAGLVGLDHWLHPDPSVLEAVQQATHDHVLNSLDLWHEVRTHHYHLWSESSLDNWRGHVGEQVVFDHLHSWLGDRVQLEPLSNHPGSDMSIDGHDFNIKVTEDYANVASHHFANYPDTPLILNTDAAHLPPDALHLDLTTPFDPDMLDGHAVVVADGLSLSGIQDSLGDSFGDVMGGHLDMADVMGGLQDAGIPVLGSAIRVVRSGIRENRLREVHGDSGRMVKNIATDVAVVGGSVATGVTAGHIIGTAVDILTFGATGGLGTVFGGVIGGALGGLFGNKAASSIRLEPFHDAQTEARAALGTYNDDLDAVSAETEQLWAAKLAESKQRCAHHAASLQEMVDQATAHAETDLRAENLIGTVGARRELDEASQRVDLARGRERSLLALWRARRWRAAAAAAASTAEMFDAVLAAPDGSRAVEEVLTAARQQRETAVATLIETGRIASEQAARVRAAEVGFLTTVRSALHDDAAHKMEKPLHRVQAANAKVLTEARAAGLVG